MSKKEAVDAPFKDRWRRVLLLSYKFIVRIMLYFMGYYQIVQIGKKATVEEAPMLVANHTSFIDPFFLVSAFVPSPVGAREHLTIPIVGDIVAALQTVTVDRKSPTSRKDVIEALKNRCVEKGWPQLLVFPEGTCTNNRALITFKPGT